MHAVYWTVTHPVNKVWLKDQNLNGVGRDFFRFDPLRRQAGEEAHHEHGWERLRDRWEYSHIVRAILAAIALIALIVAVAR